MYVNKHVSLFIPVVIQRDARTQKAAAHMMVHALQTRGEPSSSRRSFPGARFPEERRRPGISPARILRALMYCDVHRCCASTAAAAGYMDVCTIPARKNRERNFSSLLCHHTWWPRCRLLGVALGAMRCDAMRCDAMRCDALSPLLFL